MSYRVCIPCAGTGSRLGSITQFINKSLVSIANRPALCHLIELFPEDAEFVIVLGHKGNLIREFLSLAYPSRQFFFSEVTPFEGPGSGLGLSLQTCKQHLQQPFVFISCDTIVDEKIPALDKNWMGYSDIQDIDSYRTIAVTSNRVSDIAEKGKGQVGNKTYIGLAGIHDYKEFWNAMENGGQNAIDIGESLGLRGILKNSIQAYSFTWHDIGNPDSLAQTREFFREPNEPNILEKANESIWFVGENVIKFSDDKDFIANRVKRAQHLHGFVPDVNGSQTNMYRYPKVDGDVLSEVITLPLFELFLKHCESFWTKESLQSNEVFTFNQNCMKFYRIKTYDRVELFYQNFDCKDGAEYINDKPMPTLNSLLGALDWDWLATGIPGRFHGDFHFENILWNKKQFVFLDWRQDFAGDLKIGDIYYDFAKLLHGLIINHEIITDNLFSIDWNKDNIKFDFNRKHKLVECERIFEEWVYIMGYDFKKVRVLTSLIFLNIAALHHKPYSLLLYALGKSMLNNEMDN